MQNAFESTAILSFKSKRIATMAAGMLVCLFLVGCMVGPDFVKPSAPEPSNWLAAADQRVKTDPAQAKEWWTLFNDPILASLVDAAYRKNLTLQIAGFRVLEARARLGIAVGDLYPQQQQARGDLLAIGTSKNAFGSLPGDRDFTEASIGFDAAWEVDLWGKFRRAVESEKANHLASIASYGDVLVTLTADVARAYILLRTFEERMATAQRNVEIQQRSLDIAQVRYNAGAATELDVLQAQSLLEDTRAQIPRFQAGIRQAKNALAIFTGRLPGAIDIEVSENGGIPEVPAVVAVGIPADLMRRRPDIRFAEYRLAAQSALVGVAKADLYPHFALLGSVGLRAAQSNLTASGDSNLGDFFGSSSLEYFVGPSFRWDLFNYGRIKNQVRVEQARMRQTEVLYQETVLRAHQEVEDALVRFLKKQDETAFLKKSVAAAQRSVDLSLIQYREGLVDYQRVLDSQRFLSQEQDLLTEARGAMLIDLIAVYKALGGGWKLRKGEPINTDEKLDEIAEETGL